MLGKLMKYELKATARIFLLLYIAVVFLAVVNRIIFAIDTASLAESFGTLYGIMIGSFTTLYVLMLITLFVTVTIVVIQRFYKNLFGDEGYLMLTLPVKSWEHILAKMFTASIWMFASMLATLISVAILISIPEVLEVLSYNFSVAIENLRELEFSITPFVVEAIAIIVISHAGFALPLYACISIGQLWKRHRVLGAFLAYFALSFATQLITSVIISVVSVPALMRIGDMNYDAAAYTDAMLKYFHSIMIISIVITLIIYVACFFITKYIIDKKLDIE